jgi:hypothetical protein
MLLAAVVLNEIAHLKLNDDPALAWATAHNPFSENWDRTWGIAELNPLAIVGNIETRWALPKADGLAGYISRLENPLWAVVYAAGWLGTLSMRFAEQGVIATSDDLKIAYRGGAIYEGGVIDSRHRGQPYSAPAAAQLASVDAFYYAGNVDELAAQMFEHQESIVGKIFRLVDPITPRCLLC